MDKRHIIEEIRRTAEDNGGTPLGRQKFFQATGIKTSDWEGKLSVRWSDAVREAGFVPNRMQSAYDEEELLEKYVLLIQELHSLPTVADLKFKSRNDADFPSHSTFSRFGSKSQLITPPTPVCSAVRNLPNKRDECADENCPCPEHRFTHKQQSRCQQNHKGCETLAHLIRVLRNGVTHFDIEFIPNTDTREIEVIEISNRCTCCNQITTTVRLDETQVGDIAERYARLIVEHAGKQHVNRRPNKSRKTTAP